MLTRKELGNDGSFIIAEVGQNHQGDLDNAREFIKIFSAMGADAVKFQTRDNKYLFSKEAYNMPYNSENAFDPIYGKHREKLELKKEWLHILKEDCQKYGVKFMSTPFDEPSLDFICEIGVDLIKIASFDLGNLPFIEKISKKGLPVVISIGGGKEDQIRSSIDMLLSGCKEIAVLNCVSEYPCPYDRLNLQNIPFLIKEFPDCIIGSSDHFNGTLSGPIAFMQGARVFEKHVTLNRSWPGTDHGFALEPEGFRKFVRDIRRTPEMMNSKPAEEVGNEPVFMKLGKSLVAIKELQKGTKLESTDLSGKIFSTQIIPVRESNSILGMTLNKKIMAGDPIRREDLI